MHREPKNRMPKAARYPLFFLGLAIIILGGLFARSVGATVTVDLEVVAAGFTVLFLSVALR